MGLFIEKQTPGPLCFRYSAQTAAFSNSVMRNKCLSVSGLTPIAHQNKIKEKANTKY